MWRLCLLVAALSAGAVSGETEERETTVFSEYWAAIRLGDQKIGHTHQVFRSAAEGAGDVSSEWSTRLAFRRGESLLEFEEHASVLEAAAGRVRRYVHRVLQYSGGAIVTATEVAGTVEGDGLHVTSAGYERVFPFSPEARGPWYLQQRILRERSSGEGHVFEQATFSPELGAGMQVRVEVGPWEAVALGGQEVRLQRVTQTLDVRPGHPDIAWLDAQGVAQVAQVDIPMLGKASIVQCSMAEALTPSSPVELMTSAVIPSPVRVESPRGVRRARFRLVLSPGGKLYEGENQQVQSLADGTTEVTISPPATVAVPGGYEAPYLERSTVENYLRPTPFLESDHPLIVDMAREAAGDLRNSVQLAWRLEQFVRRRIHSKTLDMGFASALETARALKGDCSEHAVLVAALARALGVPSRVVVGLAYVNDGTFGAQHANGVLVFHVWTELLVATGVWLPVDAALGGFDATHIAFTKSALASASPLVDLCLPVLGVVDHLEARSVEILEPSAVSR